MTDWAKYEFKEYIKAEQIMFNLPLGVSISTMCGKCKLGTQLNIDFINTHLLLSSNDILTVKINNENMRTLIEKKAKKRRTTKKIKTNNNPFYNQITVVVRVNEGTYNNFLDEPKLNIKLFKNGSIQMSGLKNIEYANRALNKLVYCLSQVKAKIIDGVINEIQYVENIKTIGISNFEIYMINSNYKINLMVDRAKLYGLLLQKKIKASYEKCVRACVIVKYIPSTNNKEDKDVSVFIFEKGNIIITGARNFYHIIDTYEYINNIILEHVDDIIKKNDEVEGNMILQFYEDIYKEYEHKLKYII
jgi:TATA-box binding protein (TBP) (component of TFIID and TFIIIB)